MFVTLIVFVIILGLLIFVHELGHFLMAKRSGIKVEEFAFGFPPRIFAVKKGETEYALNLIPFGGYVKMLGEDENHASESVKKNPRSYAHQSMWNRSKVVVAGVVMNIIFGWLLITLGYMLGMPPLVTTPEKIPYAHINRSVALSAIASPSAATSMGLKVGDEVIRLNDMPITSREQLSTLTKENKGKAVSITVMREKQEITVNGTLGEGEGPLGVRLADDTSVRLPIWWAPIYAAWETVKAFGLIFVGILAFFKQIFVSQTIPAEASGPVGIFYYTRSVLELGFTPLLNFVAVLSINLAAVNIMPIPALDGGRLLFIILEKFNKGKKLINQQIENTAHLIGFVLLILLILTITYNDILRIGQ